MNSDDPADLNKFVNDAARFLAQKKGQKVIDRLDRIMESYDYDYDEDKLVSKLTDLYDFILEEFEL